MLASPKPSVYDRPCMKRRDWIRWLKGASLVVALLAAPISAMASLAIGSSAICSISCCVKEGHCCCSPQRARVKQVTDSERRSIENAEVDNQCPGECALLRASSSFFRDPARGAHPALVASVSISIRSYDPPISHNLVELGSSSPRAPPVMAGL